MTPFRRPPIWDRVMGRFWGLVLFLAFVPVIPAILKLAMPIITVVLGSVLLLRWLWRWYRQRWW